MQVTRLYRNKEHAEVEYTFLMRELGALLNLATIVLIVSISKHPFYMDIHTEHNLQVRNYREDWDLEKTEPVAGNYYPVFMFS
ncbi:hypothetical protein HU200_011532 [Digitaria exilis]|uniref:Uncharacterized protein n=1 Tax=Digitaria exilis TaxID=1010633 RepID=A0A835FG59_9POAL|nr:hypothetical protein HU200_011532 [Digitaria exilis]